MTSSKFSSLAAVRAKADVNAARVDAFGGGWRIEGPLAGKRSSRRGVAISPGPIRYALSQLLAVTVYWPLARAAAFAEKLGASVEAMPLSAYRHRSFYVMRTDALDRFGTRLEQRFTRKSIEAMMEAAGLRDIRFSEGAPFWCAVGTKI